MFGTTTTRRSLLSASLVALLAAGCAGPSGDGSPDLSTGATGTPQAPALTAGPVASPTRAPEAPRTLPPPETECVAESGDIAIGVPSNANIFGAGHASPPAPGDGGAGILPPAVPLPAGGVIVTFPCADGLINCCFGAPDTPPSGTDAFSTDLESWEGISGLIHGSRSVFLVGVFLGDAEPADPAPKRLDFTDRCELSCDDARIEPKLGQTFFIGAGGADRPRYVAPDGATRLFLGLADGYFTTGLPGWYGNNSGGWTVIVRLR